MSSQLLVRSMTVESEGVLSIELVDPQGRELPSWEPGAHLDVQLTAGMSRQYSLCGDPHDRLRYRIAVLREPAGRGGSAYVHDVLRPGQLVGYTGPRNHFRLEPSATYLFIAGGIGITPILPMIARLEAEGARWRLVYGGRTASSMAFTGELAAHRDSVALHPQDAHGLLDLDTLLAHAAARHPRLLLWPRAAAAGGRGSDGRSGRPRPCTSSGSRLRSSRLATRPASTPSRSSSRSRVGP